MNTQNYWKKCSVCKHEIAFSTVYQICSVSTCQSKRTGLTFCSVACWDSHLGFANHRSADAEERHSPSQAAFEREQAADNAAASQESHQPAARRIIARPEKSAASYANIQTDILVVVSKVKKLIKEQSGFNTSQCAVDALTRKVIKECLKAIDKATEAERKTVMGRDVE